MFLLKIIVCRLKEQSQANKSLSSPGMSKKYIIGAGKSQTKLKRPEVKKKNKYSNMKMLYQNAVYKSLNLNLSPSNSSRSNSRDIVIKNKERASASANKYTPVVGRVQTHNSSGAKFGISKNNLSSERKYKIKSEKRDLIREHSEGNFKSNKNIGVSQNQSSLTQQFYSPSESRKLLK